MAQKQNVNVIVSRLTHIRAGKRQIPLLRRQINVYPRLRGDYQVNRFEIKIKTAYAVTGNPFDMIDPVLDAVVEFDRRQMEERARQITQIKSKTMKWTSYLERTLSEEEYTDFMLSLMPFKVRVLKRILSSSRDQIPISKNGKER